MAGGGCGVFKALLIRRAISCRLLRVQKMIFCVDLVALRSLALRIVPNTINIGPIMGWPSACFVSKNSTYFGEI